MDLANRLIENKIETERRDTKNIVKNEFFRELDRPNMSNQSCFTIRKIKMTT